MASRQAPTRRTALTELPQKPGLPSPATSLCVMPPPLFVYIENCENCLKLTTFLYYLVYNVLYYLESKLHWNLISLNNNLNSLWRKSIINKLFNVAVFTGIRFHFFFSHWVMRCWLWCNLSQVRESIAFLF